MTDPFDLDRIIESALKEDGPPSAPPAVVEAALWRSRGQRQRRPLVTAFDRRSWPAATWSLADPAIGRLAMVGLVLLLAIALLGGAVAVGGRFLRQDAPAPPTSTISSTVVATSSPFASPVQTQGPRIDRARFIRPFEYTIPADSDIRPIVEHGARMVSWGAGPVDPPDHIPADAPPFVIPDRADVRGVVVAAADQAWSHGTDGRFRLRTEPAAFLADLRDTAHLPIGPITEVTLDGRPALASMLSGPGAYNDIHVRGGMQGMTQYGDYVVVEQPARLTVADVDGTTVFILVWARTTDDLTRWLPVADEFVASFHFE